MFSSLASVSAAHRNCHSALSRRELFRLAAGASALALAHRLAAAPVERFRLRYVLSTSVYGNMPIADIVEQVRPAACEGLDVWAGRWGNQREQIEAMGADRFRMRLEKSGTRVCCFTCMDTGMLKAEPPLRAMHALGGDTVVAMLPGGVPQARELRGESLRQAIHATAEKLKPIVAVAGGLGVKLAIENHSGGLLATPEALGMLMDAVPERHVGLAIAPYHLPQDPALLGRLVGELGERLLFFYAWQHGDGSGELPPDRQRQQLPGIGPLDFKPMLAALKRNKFAGWTSVFMHPTPRGAPLHPTAGAVTMELNRARAFLDAELARA